MSLSLEQRISSALGGSAITSSALGDLIAETDRAAAAATAEAVAERAKALDVEQEVDLTTVHAAMEKAGLKGDRLRAAMPRLRALFDQVTGLEYANKWRADFDEVANVRDALAAELNETYPAIVATISDLMTRIEACDREASRVNSSAPSGERLRLCKVELEARGLDSFTRNVPPITDELKLPPWQPGGQEWPMAKPFYAAMVAAITPRPFDRRFSPD
jgi:hypothetical protein